jgi:N-acetylneuraminate synthase
MFRIIAEIGSVHDGSFGNAVKLTEAAAACGADTVKFQTHIAEAETLADAPMPSYFTGEPRMAYFRRTGFSPDQWRGLRAACERCGINFLSSPFSLEAVDLLEAVGVAAYKVPSGEVSNLPLLERIAATGKPVLLSSGMSDWKELDAAVGALRGGGPVTVLQCSSAYPCPPEQVGLNVLAEMRARYSLPVGFSDHTNGPAAAFAAAALGASVIEKHFTLARAEGGVDSAFSLEPHELRALVVETGRAAAAMGEIAYGPTEAEKKSLMFRRSLYLVRDIEAGEVLTKDNVRVIRPAGGLAPREFDTVLGMRARRKAARGTPLTWDLLT